MGPLVIACGIVGEESCTSREHEDTEEFKTGKKDVLHRTWGEETRELMVGGS
jgi:hypothetical protein